MALPSGANKNIYTFNEKKNQLFTNVLYFKPYFSLAGNRKPNFKTYSVDFEPHNSLFEINNAMNALISN